MGLQSPSNDGDWWARLVVGRTRASAHKILDALSDEARALRTERILQWWITEERRGCREHMTV